MILLIGLYSEPEAPRRQEIDACLQANLAVDCIERIEVFLEDHTAEYAFDLTHPKLSIRAPRRRVAYQDLFALANAHHDDRVCVVANNDVYFDETLARAESLTSDQSLLCLSRWELQPNGALPERAPSHHVTQDAWIFRAPLRPFPCDWWLGVPGCDNRLAHEATAAGMVVANPSDLIRVVHLHASNIRRVTEADRLRDGPYRYVPQI